jgi:multiple sugar transport system permease protein
MPIISRIGARSIKVRLIYASIFVMLILGAITMVYPFLLMLSGSVKSEADAFLITPYPEFWFKDAILFQKYAESKYNSSLDRCKAAWNLPVANWRKITSPPPVGDDMVRDFIEWRETLDASVGILGHTGGIKPKLLPHNARLYRRLMADRYQGNLDQFCRETGQMVSSWNSVFPPTERVGRYRNLSVPEKEMAAYRAFKLSRPRTDWIIPTVEGSYVRTVLIPTHTPDIQAYNREHGTSYGDYRDIRFPARAPTNAAERADWEDFVRNSINLEWIRLDESLAPAYRRFLREKGHPSIDSYNRVYKTACTSFSEVAFVSRLDDNPKARIDWENFVKDREACPLDAIEIHGPEQAFDEFVAAKRGRLPAGFPRLGAIAAAADWHDCRANSAGLRREFTTRNYRQVMEYIALHGNGLRNTVIYCLLAIITALIVNPLAAYALSRFRLPGTYKILLFCMATMAFPGEVTMIPGFILLKRFPLWPILGGTASVIVTFLVLEKALPSWSEKWRSLTSLAAGVLIGAVVIPIIDPQRGTVSLLNTFSALILPGVANGYFIFLLKGFFDSLPRELYEAADIDGAGEWTKFWMLTMHLSKPILAVIALGAFTTAYSAFMMALIIIPDQEMWTIMVWIYQLQSQSHQAVVYASLVLAALPTFLIFVVCQNVIMRGIVVPVEK